MKKIIISLMVFLSYIYIYGQRTCGSELNLTEIQTTNPAMFQRIMNMENQIQIHLNDAVSRGLPQSTIIIPVVVHVVYNSSVQNISDAQIISQIQVLNEDFRRLNADRINTPSVFTSVAGDANIEFKLAQRDPNGNSTTGITRTSTAQTSFDKSNAVKYTSSGGKNAWDTQKYLNIWVCNLSGTLMGYAQFPSDFSVSPNTDGVVINYKYFGRGGSAVTPYDKGRTATHEIGHWLNLRHIWGDEYNCSASDFVDDTPNQYSETYGCPSFPRTDYCTSTSSGIMFMNYMDYTDDACMNLFTERQIVRMRALFDSETGIRKQMLATAEHLTHDCPTTSISNNIYPNVFYDLFGIRTFNITGCNIEFANTTIKSNATVNVRAKESVVLKPGFWAKPGSNVSIKIVSSGASLIAANHLQTEEETTENVITYTQDITSSTDWILMNIYSLTGSLVYQSKSNFELRSLPLQKGIYIVEKINNVGNAVREKIVLTE